jgi:hypothetical protein
MHVVVPEDRQLTISLPVSVPPGDAEVIVLVEGGEQPTDSARAMLDVADAWRRSHPERQAREDIDRYLEAERATWAGGL